MNWTGGTLSRSRKATRGGYANKQKEYFAKARNSQSLHGRSGSLQQIELFGRLVTIDSRVSCRGLRSSSVRRSCNQSRETSHDDTEERQSKRRRFDSREASSLQHKLRDDTISPEERPRTTTAQASGAATKTCSPFTRLGPVNTGKCGRSQEEFLEQRRRKLLNQPDWLVSEPLQPLMQQPPRKEDNHEIGRRRQLSSCHNSEHPKRERQRPETTYKHNRGPRRPNSGFSKLGHGDLKITIGGKRVHAKSHSRNRGPSVPGTISDVMLLDWEEPRTNTEDPEVISIHSRRYRHGSYGATRRSQESLSLYERVAAALSQQRSMNEAPIASRDLRVTPSSVDMRSSSLFDIAQPQPRSSKTSRSIHSLETAAETDVARVGAQRPVVSPSLVKDNEMWANWMAPTSDSYEMLGARYSAQASISPGVSCVTKQATSVIRPKRDFDYLGSGQPIQRSPKIGQSVGGIEDRGDHVSIFSSLSSTSNLADEDEGERLLGKAGMSAYKLLEKRNIYVESSNRLPSTRLMENEDTTVGEASKKMPINLDISSMFGAKTWGRVDKKKKKQSRLSGYPPRLFVDDPTGEWNAQGILPPGRLKEIYHCN